MALEQVIELEVLPKYIERFVSTEALKVGRMDATIHAGRRDIVLEPAAAEIITGKPWHHSPRPGA